MQPGRFLTREDPRTSLEDGAKKTGGGLGLQKA